MSTEIKAANIQPVPVEPPLSLQELGGVLVKHYGFHEGLYALMIEFQIGMGPVGPTPETLVPGAMVGVSRIGLMATREKGPRTIDAAEVNPRPKKRLGHSATPEKPGLKHAPPKAKRKTTV
ncbi:MAG TPA: hypothetical protein VMV91_16025 [Rhodocyclaceae bacterium]|nr:hypothetical protein [Rhodocyclaceae bacterium]